MKNHKQLLADFYLALLAIPEFHPALRAATLSILAFELDEDVITVQRIFERMAAEDAKHQIKVVCCDCGAEWTSGAHVCQT